MVFKDKRSTRAVSNSLSTFKESLLNHTARLAKNSIFIFTCGARPNDNKTCRELLMNYAENHLPQFNFFMAEKIFDVLGEKDDVKDWLTVEEQLADYSDCIIIVLESQSTYSELGAFMLEDRLAKNVLVINDLRYKKSKSFITLGPLSKLERVSEFKPVIHTKFKNFSKCFSEVEDRLEKIERKRDKPVSLKGYGEFKEANSKFKLLFILDLISILTPVKKSEVLKTLKFLYGEDRSYDDIHLLIPLLLALDLIEQKGEYLIRTLHESHRFFSFPGIHLDELRTDVLNNYFKNSRERFGLLSSRIG